MICLDRKQLFRYAHHLLNPQEVAQFRAHLGGCSRCREAVIHYERIDAVLDEWKPVEPSAGFDAGVRQAVGAQQAYRAAWSFWGPGWARSFALVALGVFVIAGEVWLARSQRPVPNPPALGSNPSEQVSAPISSEVAKVKPVIVAPARIKKPAKPATELKSVSSSLGEDEDARALDDDDLVANFDILSELPKRDTRVAN